MMMIFFTVITISSLFSQSHLQKVADCSINGNDIATHCVIVRHSTLEIAIVFSHCYNIASYGIIRVRYVLGF